MCALAEMVADRLDEKGWTLRSGHAPGMDQAFETGASRNAEVYLPWPSFEKSEPLEANVIVDRPTTAAYNIAARFHPAWDRASKGAQALHARNVHQVLGRDCDDPSRFLLCWTLNGEVRGGTGMTIRVAREYRVPVYNLSDPNILSRVERLLVLDWGEAHADFA